LVAKQYIDAGWSVVPLVKGEKRASSSWQKRIYTPEDFGSDDGIAGKCGEPSGWRVDVDLDSLEAVAAAKLLLPSTGLIHGRPGKPDSHYWFICSEIRTTQFTDIRDAAGKSGMIVEIRSTGGYTALPPSGHPSGDVLAWVIERAPLTMTPEDLYGAVRSVAIAALLIRHWPGHGATHAAVGPLAGFLCQGGVDSPTVIEIIKTAATLSGADIRDCVNYATSTVGKFRAGENVTGGPKLTDALGESVVAKMRGWLKMADLDAIEEMNAKHFWVRMGKDDVIGREDDASGVVFQKVRALYSEYANRKVKLGEDDKGNEKFQPLFPAWLEAKNRRSYRKVVFSPPPRVCGDEDYNLWRGYDVAPVPGDCQLFLEHLEHIICSNNQEHYHYLLNLLALTIQEPGTPSEVATVLRGEPGTGKGTFVRALGRVFGKHFVHLDKVEQLAGTFNAALSGKVIVFADEAFWAGDKREIGALKRLVTEPTLHVVRKGIDGVDEANHIHLFMATNDEWSIPAQLKERRFFALHVSSSKLGDTAYFNRLESHLFAGGLAAFVHLMMTRPIDRDLVRSVPRTDELRTQQNQSLSLELKWWQECLFDEKMPGDGWAEWVPVSLIFEAYELWARGRSGRVLDKLEFGRRMSKYVSAGKAKAKRVNGSIERCIEVYGLEEARKTFDSALGTNTEWPDLPGASSNAKIPF
jgi:hypothetical protein